MQQFIDKLISRLEEEIPIYHGKMKEIVNQLAEEYKKEWSKDYGWKLTKRFIEEKYFKRIYEISEKYDYPCENIALDMNWMFGLIEKIENKFTEEYKPRTNADRIRSATDEELVNLLCDSDRVDCFDCKHEDDDVTCEQCWLDWLQSEVKDGE